MSASLTFAKVGKTYLRPSAAGRETVLRDFSLEVRAGELVAIVGRSGIGKTTLLHLAAGLEAPDAGEVRMDVAGKPRVGMVFQQPRLLDWLSVIDNIRIAAEAAGTGLASGRRMLAAVGLAPYERAYPLALSGGQRQRVALARAFAVAPDFILLDEPFSALDELTGRRLRIVLQDLWRKQGPTGLLVTHNTLEAAFLADRVVVLDGPPAQIADIIEVTAPRPRSPEDPDIFACHRAIIASLQRTERDSEQEPYPALQ